MGGPFERDIHQLREDLTGARDDLERLVSGLTKSDLTRSRRGGWTVARVLQHVLESERAYARVATRILGALLPDSATDMSSIITAEAIAEMLRVSREALWAAVEGADEESFYRLERVGHEEYSIASLLENVASHDREHAIQIRRILEPN
jgi:uncharacterized damage-inducible protein DinB